MVTVRGIMKRTKLKWLVVIASGLLVLLGCLNTIIRPLEPHYDGMPLRYWVHRTGEPGSFYSQQKTEDALKAMSVAAVPQLIRWLETPDVPLVDPLIDGFIHKCNRDLWYFAITGRRLRCLSIWALEEIGGPGNDVVPHLIARLRDHDPLVRRSAADALWRFPVQFELTVPALVTAMSDPDGEVRSSAAMSLGYFPAQFEVAVPVLVKVLSDPNARVRRSAVSALRHFPSQFGIVVPVLVKAASDPDPLVRTSAVQEMRHFPDQHGTVIPTLGKAMGDPSSGVVTAAVRSLPKFGTNAFSVLPILTSLAGHPDRMVRAAAAESLEYFGTHFPPVPITVPLPPPPK